MVSVFEVIAHVCQIRLILEIIFSAVTVNLDFLSRKLSVRVCRAEANFDGNNLVSQSVSSLKHKAESPSPKSSERLIAPAAHGLALLKREGSYAFRHDILLLGGLFDYILLQ